MTLCKNFCIINRRFNTCILKIKDNLMATTELEEIEDKERLLSSEEKTHPWRLCSTGKHFVKKHIVHMNISNC